jgi:hypothetical protein
MTVETSEIIIPHTDMSPEMKLKFSIKNDDFDGESSTNFLTRTVLKSIYRLFEETSPMAEDTTTIGTSLKRKNVRVNILRTKIIPFRREIDVFALDNVSIIETANPDFYTECKEFLIEAMLKHPRLPPDFTRRTIVPSMSIFEIADSYTITLAKA